MSPLANLLSRGKEAADPSLDVSDLAAMRPTLVARVNLLPPEIAEAERFRREQVLRGAAVAAAVLVVAAIAVGASHQVSNAQAGLDAAQQRSSELTQQKGALSDVPETTAEVATAESQRTLALGNEVRWSEYLNNLGLVTPEGVQLLTMQVTQNVDSPAAVPSVLGTPGIASVAYTGEARNNDDVALFLDGLASQAGTVDPYFTQAVVGTDAASKQTVIDFTASSTVTPAAESGRYKTNGG